MTQAQNNYISPFSELCTCKKIGYNNVNKSDFVEEKHMELCDAYGKNFHYISSATLIRGESIPDGLFHLVCDIIVKHTDGDYLLMQRDSRKHFGGMWEATAGGAALQGEAPLDCAIRELYEETGIAAKKLAEVGRVVNEQNHSLYVEFLYVTDCSKDSIIL